MSNSESNSPVRRRAWVPRKSCPMARAAESIGDRWILLILREAFYGVQRYDDMRQDLAIPRSVLTDRLKKLVADGLLERFEYQEQGDRRRYAYALSEAGRALAPAMVALTEWGERFLTRKPAPVGLRHRGSGEWLQLGLIDGRKRPVEWRDAVMARRPVSPRKATGAARRRPG